MPKRKKLNGRPQKYYIGDHKEKKKTSHWKATHSYDLVFVTVQLLEAEHFC